MTPEELAELARLEAAATPGVSDVVLRVLDDLLDRSERDILVAARNALPKLLRDIHDLDRFARRVLHVAESMDWDANTGWNGIADAIGSLPPDLYETLGGGKE